VVAKENLGTNLGLFAAAALVIDYVLNVAVGISPGVGVLAAGFRGTGLDSVATGWRVESECIVRQKNQKQKSHAL
jgi:hypothetical protein